MGSRIAYTGGATPRGREPRAKSLSHLAFIRSLPCVLCGILPVDPAHLRAGNPLYGKRPVGAGEKPDDIWTTPLCRKHHDEQHAGSEVYFWLHYGIDNPWALALALSAASIAGDLERAERIVAEHRLLVGRRK